MGIVIAILVIILLILLIILLVLRVKPACKPCSIGKDKPQDNQCDFCKQLRADCTCTPADRLIRKNRKPIPFSDFSNECVRLFHNDDDKLKTEFVQLSNDMRDRKFFLKKFYIIILFVL